MCVPVDLVYMKGEREHPQERILSDKQVRVESPYGQVVLKFRFSSERTLTNTLNGLVRSKQELGLQVEMLFL